MVTKMKLLSDEDMSAYFSGEKLYGDDFDQPAIQQWFADEAEGYADLGAKDKAPYQYGYHALNDLHGFRYLDRNRKFRRAMGFGSAYGDELAPIAGRIQNISIVDPSDAFVVTEINGTPVSYFKPAPTGCLPFEDESFDLVTSLGVLHHIPNVSYVVSELYRCMEFGGIALIREPSNSMGDWRKPRRGLTRHERGIPIAIMRRVFQRSGFKIERATNCFFPLTPRLCGVFGVASYNNRFATALDQYLSDAFAWNYSYHRFSVLKKFAPSAVFWVLRK